LILKEKEIESFVEFFKQESSLKAKHSAPYSFGWSKVTHKEGLRLLTGSRQKEMKAYIPEKLEKIITNLSTTLDKTMVSLMSSMARPIFNANKMVMMAKEVDLPFGFGGQIGMLDAAYYYNAKSMDTPEVGTSVENVNCVAHFDPGFLSISILSTSAGLQLQDPTTKKWIDGPLGLGEQLGVIWTGQAATDASNGKIPAGIHRVRYPTTTEGNAEPRLTIWYEMCTASQCEPPTDDVELDFGKATEVNMKGIQNAPINLNKAKKASNSRTPNVLTHAGFLQHIEREMGLPMSKMYVPPAVKKPRAPQPAAALNAVMDPDGGS